MKHFLNTAAIATALAFAPSAAVWAATPLAALQTSSASTIARLSVAPFAAPVEQGYDISGIPSNDEAGSPFNFVGFAFLGANSRVVGIGWDLTLTTFGGSFLSEAVIGFTDASLSAGVNLTTGIGDAFGGTRSYSSGGIIDLVGLSLDFSVGADGNLRVEFFESFDDNFQAIDANYDRGALFVRWIPEDSVVPEPATWAMMIAGFGLVGFAARRRGAIAHA